MVSLTSNTHHECKQMATTWGFASQEVVVIDSLPLPSPPPHIHTHTHTHARARAHTHTHTHSLSLSLMPNIKHILQWMPTQAYRDFFFFFLVGGSSSTSSSSGPELCLFLTTSIMDVLCLKANKWLTTFPKWNEVCPNLFPWKVGQWQRKKKKMHKLNIVV